MKLNLFLLFFCALILALSLRGLPGNATATQLNTRTWMDSGPFELSPERGRYALTYSLAVNHSPFFTVPMARFIIPDLGYMHGHYVSLFAPGVSYIAIPGFLIGKYFGASQVGAFAVVSVFAILNALLIHAIGRRLGLHPAAAVISALIFLFATPAFAYGVTLYQHHISTFLILASIYLLVRWKGSWPLFGVWFLCAASIPIDYPNLFLMAPIGIYGLGRVIRPHLDKSLFSLSISLLGIISFITLSLPLMFFLWFNKISYGNPLQFSGTVPGVREIDDVGLPAVPKNITSANIDRFLHPELQQKSALGFFQARNLLNGINIHLLSPDRSVLFFTPVVIFALIGMYYASKTNNAIYSVLAGILFSNIIFYSLWGDPWGGWAFGSRYLIPGYAIAAIFLSLALTRLSKNIIFLSLFLALAFYSISVNTLGALTSSANPPQIQILELEKASGQVQKYTYARNWDILQTNNSKSFFYQSIASQYLSAGQYYFMLVGLISAAILSFTVYLYFSKSHV